jgi:CO dehydrogenase/acetyl-CoA synthase gamma subunit (corrinoid Fe-S protein)
MLENNNCCDTNEKKTRSFRIKAAIKDQDTNEQSGCGCKGTVETASSCCCGNQNPQPDEPITKFSRKDKWITGEVRTPSGIIPQVATKLLFSDVCGSWKARWGFNRMNYKINPGLYAVGSPDSSSPVLVTANYKMSFDMLRKELTGLNAWILVLDTKGINVWCAAGKGTFGTKELVNRINKTRLQQIVTHRTLILPQLGAPGVSAYEVARHTGFKVVFGPVRAKDVKSFISAGMKATAKMRTVRFNIWDRLVLTPMEFIQSIKITLLIFGVLFILNVFSLGTFGIIDFMAYMGAVLIGCVVTPVLLPFIPGRAFAWKGWFLGLIWAVAVLGLCGWPFLPLFGLLKALGFLLVLPSIAAFYSMNFTGASTYTSLSGVLKEMKVAVPAIIVTIIPGVVLILLDSFIKIM